MIINMVPIRNVAVVNQQRKRQQKEKKHSRMKHEQYKNSLFKGKQTCVVGHTIRSHDHELFSEKIRKVALSPFDDKRYVMNDGFTTLAHGHYSI